VYLADGRGLKVKHPEFMAISPGARIIHVVGDDGGIESVDLLMVVSLERAVQKRKPPSNGNGRHQVIPTSRY
jgi:hypothetical protein